jgi:hypothetical protein
MVFQRAKMPLSLRLGGIFDLQWVCAYEFRNRYSIHLSYGATLESSVYLTVQFFLDAAPVGPEDGSHFDFHALANIFMGISDWYPYVCNWNLARQDEKEQGLFLGSLSAVSEAPR